MTDFDTRKQWQAMRALCADIAGEYAESGIVDHYDYVHESADGLHDVIHYHAAWRAVMACKECDTQIYDLAHDSLIDTGGDHMQKDETIDNVIVRLSYWIHHTLIMEQLNP